MVTNSRADSRTKKKKYHISRRAGLISPSGIRKFFDLLATMEGVISLGVGEPDYTTPWHITEAAIESLQKGQTMYTSNSGMPELRQELARYLKTYYDLEYNPDTELLITVGVSEALDLAMRAIL
ncbi:MAG TPA: aminotransferase class I/II-fold pyridoxal phosphate-dependent enzyme, partial [Dehalococcoidia bacterium]|nr:aminotransferase class I/II-fold pyridoxal phosphate-dependent enzyme [Dehalococcoidia bacterium]